MAAVPITLTGILYPKNKTDPPYPVTFVGLGSITGLGIGGGPILPPDEVPPVEPPFEIWPGPGDPDYPGAGPHPEHPIVIPPDLPPEAPPEKGPVHAGWNFNDGSNPQYPNVGWFWVYIPSQGEAQPKSEPKSEPKRKS